MPPTVRSATVDIESTGAAYPAAGKAKVEDAVREDEPASRAARAARAYARARAQPPADRGRIRPPLPAAGQGRVAARLRMEPEGCRRAHQRLRCPVGAGPGRGDRRDDRSAPERVREL